METHMNTTTTLLIAALFATSAVLGFLYYQETKDNVGVKVDLPNVKIETP
jgi:preprotein translocase subunit SecG